MRVHEIGQAAAAALFDRSRIPRGYRTHIGSAKAAKSKIVFITATIVREPAGNDWIGNGKLGIVPASKQKARKAEETAPVALRERGVRLTRQRQILLDLIDKTGQHLDAERLFQLAKEKDPKLNRVTVYRTLKLLKEGGLVDELDLMHHEGEQHYYETRRKQEHAHVICLGCGKVEEFFGEPLQRLRKQIESHFGFQIVLARTEVGGYCPHCQSLRAQEMAHAASAAPR